MELNKKQLDKCSEKIENLWGNRICEVCNNTSWSLDEQLYVLKEYHGVVNPFKEKEMIQPILTIRCRHCGNMKIFNAAILGVVDNKSGEVN